MVHKEDVLCTKSSDLGKVQDGHKQVAAIFGMNWMELESLWSAKD